MALESLYGELTGDAHTTKIYELLTGVMNKTLETDRELWTLAEQVKATPFLKNLFSHFPSDQWLPRLKELRKGWRFWPN